MPVRELIREGKQAVRSYNQLVSAGIRNTKALAEARWNLGVLALEVAPELPDRGGGFGETQHSAAAAALRQYAEDIGIDYVTLKEYRRVVEAWATPTPPEAVTSWEQTRELAAGASGDVTPQVLLEAAREIAQADGRDEVNRDDVREVRGKVTAHDRTLAELFNTAGLKVEAAMHRVQADWNVLTTEGKEGMARLQALEKAIAEFRRVVKQ